MIHVSFENQGWKPSRFRKHGMKEPIVYDSGTGGSAKRTREILQNIFIDVDNGEVIVPPLRCLDIQSTVDDLPVYDIIHDVKEFFLRLRDSDSNKSFKVKSNNEVLAPGVQDVKQKNRGKSCAHKRRTIRSMKILCARQVHQV